MMGFDPTTFAFEVLNFIVLVVLLERMVYRPLRKGIDARRTALADREKAAADRLTEAGALEETLEERSRALDELRQVTLREASEQAARERARILEQAREDAGAERSRAMQLLESERDAALVWLRSVAIEKGTEVAGRMLLDLAPDEIDDVLFARLTDEVERRKEAIAGSLKEVGAAAEIEVTCARVPENAMLRLRETLTKVLGRPPALVLREDPSLQAGAVLRIGDHLLDASVSGQLEVFRDRARSMMEQGERVA